MSMAFCLSKPLSTKWTYRRRSVIMGISSMGKNREKKGIVNQCSSAWPEIQPDKLNRRALPQAQISHLQPVRNQWRYRDGAHALVQGVGGKNRLHSGAIELENR